MATTWTKLTKPSTTWTKVLNLASQINPGQPIGLLLALTYALKLDITVWTKVSKAAGTVWTKVAKAT